VDNGRGRDFDVNNKDTLFEGSTKTDRKQPEQQHIIIKRKNEAGFRAGRLMDQLEAAE